MFRRTDPGESRILTNVLLRAPGLALTGRTGPALAALSGLALAAFALIAVGATAPLAAQEGTITYTHSVQIDIELPPELAQMKAQFPTASTDTKVLHFGPSGSLMTRGETMPGRAAAASKAMAAKGAVPTELPMEFLSAMMTEMSVFMGSPGAASFMQGVYEDYEAGTVVETHEFLGRTFRIVEERPSYGWQLTTEQAMHLGYPVMKATTEHDSTTVEAWFTPAIPVSGGPASYGGLPGMILVLSLNDGHTQYQATEVALEELEEGTVRPPGKGQEVTREEFDRIVADKIEELTKMRGPRRIGIIGEVRR